MTQTEIQPESSQLTLWEHIVALKRTVLTAIGLLLTAASLVHWQREPIVSFLLQPLGDSSGPLQFLSPLDPLYFILKIDFTLGFLIALPFLLCTLWWYIAPAIQIRWWKAFVVVLVASSLALLAAAYAYYLVTPLILAFMSTIIIPGTTAAFTASGYLSFLLITTSILVIVFQVPLVLVGAIAIDLIEPEQITQNRPYVYVGAVALAAIVTPTTDIFTLALVAGPAIVAVELGTLTGRIFFKAR